MRQLHCAHWAHSAACKVESGASPSHRSMLEELWQQCQGHGEQSLPLGGRPQKTVLASERKGCAQELVAFSSASFQGQVLLISYKVTVSHVSWSQPVSESGSLLRNASRILLYGIMPCTYWWVPKMLDDTDLNKYELAENFSRAGDTVQLVECSPRNPGSIPTTTWNWRH